MTSTVSHHRARGLAAFAVVGCVAIGPLMSARPAFAAGRTTDAAASVRTCADLGLISVRGWSKQYGDMSVSWTSAIHIDKVIVNSGGQSLVYSYTPARQGDVALRPPVDTPVGVSSILLCTGSPGPLKVTPSVRIVEDPPLPPNPSPGPDTPVTPPTPTAPETTPTAPETTPTAPETTPTAPETTPTTTTPSVSVTPTPTDTPTTPTPSATTGSPSPSATTPSVTPTADPTPGVTPTLTPGSDSPAPSDSPSVTPTPGSATPGQDGREPTTLASEPGHTGPGAASPTTVTSVAPAVAPPNVDGRRTLGSGHPTEGRLPRPGSTRTLAEAGEALTPVACPTLPALRPRPTVVDLDVTNWAQEPMLSTPVVPGTN